MEISMLTSVIQQATGCNSSEIVPEAHLLMDLKMDASGAIVCSQQIKGVLQVHIPAEEVLKAGTVGNLLKLINMKRKEAGKTMTLDRDEIIGQSQLEDNIIIETKKTSESKIVWELEMILGLVIIIISIIMSIAHNISGLSKITAIADQSNDLFNILIPIFAAIGGLMIGWGWKKLNEKKR